ncbi:MAG: hypothetical protein AAFY91_12730 [Bacteroidota bacterium]
MQNQVIVSTEKLRGDYNRLRRIITNLDEYIVTPHILRVEQSLAENRNQYDFDLIENSSSDRPLEQKLNRNDMFVILYIRLGIAKQNEVAGDYANYPLFTYVDGNYFAAAGAAAALRTIFNGKLTLKTDNVDRLQDYRTNLLEYVPERGYLNASGDQTAPEFPQMGPSLEQKGFLPVVPNIVLSGQQNNKIQLELGEGTYTAIGNSAGDETNLVAIELFGYQINNAAEASIRSRAY